MSTEIVGVLGSVTRPGRLRGALEGMLQRVDGLDVRTRLVDLAEYSLSFADGRPPDAYGDDTAAVVAAVADSDAVVLATPIYRGTYTGSLKNLLDQLSVEALSGKPVGIVSMGATDHHSLGADWQLRDVLAWFGALVAPVAVYLTSRDFESGAPTDGAASQLDELASTLLALVNALRSAGAPLGPSPLAARRTG